MVPLPRTFSTTCALPSKSIMSSTISAWSALAGWKIPMPYSSLAVSFWAMRLKGLFFWLLIFRSNTGLRALSMPYSGRLCSCMPPEA